MPRRKLPPLPPFEDQRKALSKAKRCEVCGQAFDTRDLDQVFHHTLEPHEPLPKPQ
jgi:hypothetical protein